MPVPAVESIGKEKGSDFMGILPYKEIMPGIADDVFIAPGAWVIGDVVIARGSSIWFNTVVRADVQSIRIGTETNIQDNCTLHVTAPDFPLEMGDRVTVGHGVILHGCVIEDDCLIGMGAIILDGARVGQRLRHCGRVPGHRRVRHSARFTRDGGSCDREKRSDG